MTLSAEGARPTTSEAPKSSELSISSSVSRLGKRQEAVCAGREVHMAYLERNKKDAAPLTPEQQQENAKKVADRLKSLGVKKGEDNYTAEDVLAVGTIMEQLTGQDGPYAAVLFQTSSRELATGLTSAAIMTIVAHELASPEMKGKPQAEVLALIKGKLVDFYKKNNPTDTTNSTSHVTMGLIDKQGVIATEMGSSHVSIVTIDADGKKTVTGTDYQLKPGEKIVIADVRKLTALDGKKPLGEMMEGISGDHAISGSEVEKPPQVEVPAPVATPTETLVLKKVTYEDNKGKPHKVEEYIQTSEYQQNRVWLGKVIEAIQVSADPTVTELKRKDGESELVYTKRVVEALQKHLSAAGENEDSPLSRLASEAEDASTGENPDRGGELTTLDAVVVLLKKAPELYDPQFASAETVGSPEEVKNAFSEAFGLYEAEMQALVSRDISTLSRDEREVRARYLYTKSAVDRAKETKNWSFEVELRAHGELPSHIITEGVPVEGVMIFLQSKIEAATTAGNQEEAAKFQTLYDTLKNNSRLYREIPLKDRDEKKGAGTKFKKIDELMEARQQLEANQRHLDPLRSSTNPNDQERMQEDWNRGGQDLEVRRELVVPKGKKKVGDLGVVYEKTGNQREILKRIVEPEPVEPAPVEPDPDKPDPTKPPVAPPPEPRVITENDLQAQVVVAKDDTHYISHNNNLVDHVMSKVETSGTHWYSKVPLLGGVVGSILHPVQTIWRNGLYREAAREQNRRFVDRMSMTLKGHFVGGEGVDRNAAIGQMRIPVEVTSELIDKSLEEGRKMLREQGFLTRLWWGGRNAVARITALGETSQMHFAKQWLGDRLVEDRAGSRDPLIESIYQHALKEQDAVASRIAVKGLRRGERREVIANSPLAVPVKGAIEAYFAEIAAAEASAGTDAEKKSRLVAEAQIRLVAKVNTFGKQTSGGPIDLSTGIELSSNVLSVVNELSKPFGETGKTKWQLLQEEDKWKDFKINITTAESRWGGEGGETPIKGLRERVLRRMAERELFVGENERTHGVELATWSITADIATYGGAFVLGAGSSAALFGARTASKIVGGLGGIMGMTAAKEMGLRVGGHEVFRGRYRGEVAQVSREVALGKKGPEAARIRTEMGRALVEPGMMENADTVALRIESLLNGKDVSQMTEREAFQILREIAQLDARMRIADISGTKDLQFTTQNYIIYDELQRNEQYLRLKSDVIAGLQKLEEYGALHTDFCHGEPITGNVELTYGAKGGNAGLGLFEKFSALAEAQLRYGTRAEVLKWLQDNNGLLDNNAGLGMSPEDAKNLMNAYYSEARGAVTKEQSIHNKERVLRRLAAKRAATVVLQSAIMMPIGGAVMGMEYQVLSGVAQEVQHVIREGIPVWSKDWGDVISGRSVPLQLSTFQTAVLTVRHTVENVAHTEVLPAHDEVIDGIHVQLPGRYRYEHTPGAQPGTETERIVDSADGHVIMNLSGHDLQVDTHGKLIEVDGNGHVVNTDVVATLQSHGISIHQGETIATSHSETVLSPTGSTIDQSFDGHTMHVPSGTEWVKDAQGNNDLVVIGHHDVVLIDNAHIGADGIVSGGQLHSGVTLETSSHTIPGGSSQEIHISGPDGILTQKHDTFDVHTQRQSMYGGNENNGMAYHRPIYDYKDTNPQTGDAVYVIQAGRGDILYPAHDPSITFNVPHEMAEGHLYFTLSVPGHGDIAIPANYSAAHDSLNDALRLDPSDTHTFVTPQGHEFTYGEVAKMFVDQDNLRSHPDGILGTEYNNIWDQILHLTAPDSPHAGTITSSILTDNGKLYDFGVVRGGAPLHDVITTNTPPVSTSESLIAIAGPITTTVSGNTPTYVIDAPSVLVPPIVIPLIPIPMGRENVEPVEGGVTPQETVVPPTQTVPTPTPSPTPTPTSATSEIVLTEEEKKKSVGVVDSKAYAGPDDMMQLFGLEKGKSFGKHDKEGERRSSNERFTASQKAFIAYEKARRTLQLAKDSEKQQKQREYDAARKELLRVLHSREGGVFGLAPFKESQIDELDAYLDEQKQKKIQKQMEEDLVAKKKDEEEKKRKAGEQEATTTTTSEGAGGGAAQTTADVVGEGEEEA